MSLYAAGKKKLFSTRRARVMALPVRMRLSSRALLSLALLGAAGASAWGCTKEKPSQVSQKKEEKPQLRLIAWGGIAGALEPCGCVADMLGGIDHAGAWLHQARSEAQASLFVGAGPMFFMNPELKESEKQQALFKAEALAQSLADLDFQAWAPGKNDWALGNDELLRLSKLAQAQPLSANHEGLQAEQVLSVGGTKVGLVGVSLFGGPLGVSAEEVKQALGRLKQGLSSVQNQGAELKVALLAAPRGEALRLAELAEGFQVVVVGKPADAGELNDAPIPAMVVGKTLVVQAQNHIQGMSVVDLYVRGGNYQFADGTGLELENQRSSLQRQIEALSQRLKQLPQSTDPSLRLQKEAELAKLKKDLAGLPDEQAAPAASYFSYELVEVREKIGQDPKVAARLDAYYQRVNDYNREAFADLKPVEPAEGEKSYVGIDTCSNCHQEARKFWEGTRHAGAYETLSSQHKEFNLDCVSCHVTGYDKPGGSTVTHVDALKDVQCEACHGPGSAHISNPLSDEALVKRPPLSTCESCHHQPHVGESWTAAAALPHILGPGHGAPAKKD